MKVLGIETSCDETAAGIVDDGVFLLANSVSTSIDLHAPYGGVVPEIAARAQLETITSVIENALDQAGCGWKDIDAIAVTYGPGLGGSLLVGVISARELAIVKSLPLIACNHVLGHVFANFISGSQLMDYVMPTEKVEFPLLAIIVSGGHTQLVLFSSHLKYQVLGRTGDDAIGEAFDKVAKMLGLPYPGGPSIAKSALMGDPETYTLPIAKVGKYDFSFSGLKTAVLRLAQKEVGEDYDFPSYNLPERLNEAQRNNIAACFQQTAVNTIVDKALLAVNEFHPKRIALAGGVAANELLRKTLTERLGQSIMVPDIKLCTDNGAMIAALGGWQYLLGIQPINPFDLNINPNLSM